MFNKGLLGADRHKDYFAISSIIFHHFAGSNQVIARRLDLTDRQWEEIRQFLPRQKGRVGRASPDTKFFVNALIWGYRTGSPWRDVPEVYGDFHNIHKRYRRWYSNGI